MARDGIVARGSGEFKKHKNGEKLVRGQAIKAKCYDCMGGYIDGRVDCLNPSCPLYLYMPYRGKKDENMYLAENMAP